MALGPDCLADRVVTVATQGGDFRLLSEALAWIDDKATATTPYLVEIGPGVYTETAPVVLKSYVDVEGSGQDVTTINCACAGFQDGTPDPVLQAGPITAELRHLTVNNTGGTDLFLNDSIGVFTEGVTAGSFSMLHVTVTATSTFRAAGISNANSSPSMNHVTVTVASTGGSFSYGVDNFQSSPSMSHVTVTASGGGNQNVGVFNFSSSPTMNNVTTTATADGDSLFQAGVLNLDASAPTMTNVTAQGPYGVRNESGSSATIRNSSITGTDASIRNTASTARVADTVLDGPVDGAGFTCVGVHDEAFVALSSACAAFA
jgi:hypothetical protein